jgi:hypothetical protein
MTPGGGDPRDLTMALALVLYPGVMYLMYTLGLPLSLYAVAMGGHAVVLGVALIRHDLHDRRVRRGRTRAEERP